MIRGFGAASLVFWVLASSCSDIPRNVLVENTPPALTAGNPLSPIATLPSGESPDADIATASAGGTPGIVACRLDGGCVPTRTECDRDGGCVRVQPPPCNRDGGCIHRDERCDVSVDQCPEFCSVGCGWRRGGR
ncbi:MAG TPA: hypothetical protein VH142_20990 [Polyangiaceae bacterium]|jgi:hypothetical protein|nr:hypothetical protein [Polyangiaceae bacterium]